MNIEEVKIDTETIQLDQFLKWAGVLGAWKVVHDEVHEKG